MREIFNCVVLAAAVLLTGPCVGGTLPTESLGHIRFVNATGFEGKLFVTADGQEVNPDGYGDGYATGTAGFLPATMNLNLRHETLGEKQVSVTLTPGKIFAVVAVSEVDKKPPAATVGKATAEKPKAKLGYTIVESPIYRRGEPTNLTVVQATPMEKMPLRMGMEMFELEPVKARVIPLPTGVQFPTILFGDKEVLRLDMTEGADRVVVFFTSEAGVLRNVNFHNEVD
jgi:hypothetical protein